MEIGFDSSNSVEVIVADGSNVEQDITFSDGWVSSSSDAVEVIEVDRPDVEQDVTVYEVWVTSCPYIPPIAQAELLARAVAAIGNHAVAPAVARALQDWADQRARIPARLLADLIETETPSQGATSSAHVRNVVMPNRRTPHAHALGIVHPLDRVQ